MADPIAATPQPELPIPGADEVSLLIDGRPVVVKKGTTVLQAAEGIGVHVPHYCYHPGLSVAGNCRMCLVEIEKVPKLQIGCAAMATQGMSVKTASDRVASSRQGIMEFLLINHPLDCPICDQAGECRLQDYSAGYGQGYSRFREEKVHWPKRYDIGRSVVFDAERCIKCTRCVRFCDEVSQSHELALFQRGDHAIIGAFPGKPLDNPYSGCTVDVCPVGALTWKPFRFQARVWFLKDTPSTCAGCARGCSVNLATYKNRIHRMTPRVNPEVNGHWMCDAGRMSFHDLYDRPRLERPRARLGEGAEGAPRRVTWDEALDRAAERLRAVSARDGSRALAALVSARHTVEDLYLAKRALSEAIGIPSLAVPPHEDGEDDHLLIRRDRTPNVRGSELVGVGGPNEGRVRELVGEIEAGRVRGLVVVGEDPLGDGRIGDETLGKLDALVVIDWWASRTVAAADVALPARAYGESDGVYVNFEGRAQRARAALSPVGESEPVWRILAELGRRFGLSAEHATASDLFDEVAARVPAFGGLSHRSLGNLGTPLRGA